MRKQRNTSPLPALTPEGCGTKPAQDHYQTMVGELSRVRSEYSIARKTMRAERKRFGSVETVLVRYIANLEQQVNDLRSAIFNNLTLRPTEKK